MPNGVIILGNSGAGKSFLANVLLKEDLFKHKCSPESVTHKTEYEDFEFDGKKYAIFNIPGLIEDDQEAIERNKQEIYEAFRVCPKSVILFVFNGGAGGRIRNEDVVAFKALDKAYEFDYNSLMLVVNDLPPDLPMGYEEETGLRIKELLKLDDRPDLLFLNRINKRSKEENADLRLKLGSAIHTLTFAVHEKKTEIELFVDKINKLKNRLKKKQEAFNQKLQELEENYQIKLQRELKEKTRLKEEVRMTREKAEQQREIDSRHYTDVIGDLKEKISDLEESLTAAKSRRKSTSSQEERLENLKDDKRLLQKLNEEREKNVQLQEQINELRRKLTRINPCATQ